MKSLNPRIVRRKDDSALLTGLSYDDLCHILTLASIQHYESEKRHREEREPQAARYAEEYRGAGGQDVFMAEAVEENLREERIFLRRIRATFDLIKNRLAPQWTGEDGPVHTLSRFQIKRRLDEVRNDRSFRYRLNALISERRAVSAE